MENQFIESAVVGEIGMDETADCKAETENPDTSAENSAPDSESDDLPTEPSYRNSTKIIISYVAYLIGVRKTIFENPHEPPLLEYYEQLDKNKNAKIIRELCRLRCGIERNFGKINEKMRHEFRTIQTLGDLVPLDALNYLSAEGLSIIKKKNTLPVDYIIEINRYICDRINNCRELFPIWVDWQYIRELFIMPNGLSVQGTKAAADLFYSNRDKYPYQMYLNWIPHDDGNILFNDKKFLSLLYRQNGNIFEDVSRVTDAGESVKKSIYDFISESRKVVLVVDCENSDPYKLIATLKNLDADQISKITKIILYNDIHASTAWNIFEKHARGIAVDHIMTERVKDSKSLVDMKLSNGVFREFYANLVDSFIIAASDSDYWALIEDLPEAKFLVMLEWSKCGPDIKNALESRQIFYCYIDDFCTGNSNDIKIEALLREVRAYLDRVPLSSWNVKEMLQEVYHNTRVTMTDAEENQFYNTYIKPMSLVIDQQTGAVSLRFRK